MGATDPVQMDRCPRGRRPLKRDGVDAVILSPV